MRAASETDIAYSGAELIKPFTRSLLKTIKCLAKETDFVRRTRITRRWFHIDLLFQISIKKCILHVHLNERPFFDRSNGKKSLNICETSNRSKSLFIVNTMLLHTTLSNQSCLIMVNRTIRASFDLVYLSTSHNFLIRRINQILSVCFFKCLNFFLHCLLPI
ncbi:hypothetical protein AAHE18_06G145800 [Arachis hypogaea]